VARKFGGRLITTQATRMLKSRPIIWIVGEESVIVQRQAALGRMTITQHNNEAQHQRCRRRLIHTTKKTLAHFTTGSRSVNTFPTLDRETNSAPTVRENGEIRGKG
jgi:hypothetical protein